MHLLLTKLKENLQNSIIIIVIKQALGKTTIAAAELVELTGLFFLLVYPVKISDSVKSG